VEHPISFAKADIGNNEVQVVEEHGIESGTRNEVSEVCCEAKEALGDIASLALEFAHIKTSVEEEKNAAREAKITAAVPTEVE
jgi:hypothetical protein